MILSKKLAVFDVDGTITKEGNDSWFEITQKMVTDSEAFARHLAVWKENKLLDPYGASLIMMEQSISLFSGSTNSESVYEKAKRISEETIENNQIRTMAIETIHKHFNEGLSVIFATTSYQEAGFALLDVLTDRNLITAEMKKAILVSGTEVNWNARKIVHFN